MDSNNNSSGPFVQANRWKAALSIAVGFLVLLSVVVHQSRKMPEQISTDTNSPNYDSVQNDNLPNSSEDNVIATMSDWTANTTFQCDNFFWMHTPKTSSTFCTTLQHVCCANTFDNVTKDIGQVELLINEQLQPDERTYGYEISHQCATFYNKDVNEGKRELCFDYRPMSAHRPYNAFSDKLALGIFRDPKRRLVSAFLDSRHHEGMPEDDYEQLQLQLSNTSGNSFDRLKNMLVEYGNHHDIRGCQTKMLLGKECASAILDSDASLVDKDNIEKAKTTLRRFFFVGIFEYYEESITLFHRMANTGTQPHVVELYPQRSNSNPKLAELLYNLSDLHDPYDTVIYAEALRVFKQRYLYYMGITLEDRF